MAREKFTGKSFGAILDMCGGAGRGFDLLRLGLALGILLAHSSSIMGHSGTTAWLTSLIFGSGAHHAAPVTGATPLVPPAAAAAKQIATTSVGLHGFTGPFVRALVPMFFALSGFLVTGSAFRTRNLVRFLGLRVLRIVPALFVEVLLSAIIIGTIFTTLPLGQYFSHPMFWAYFLNIVGDIHFFLPGVFGPGQAVNANLWTLPFELECYGVMSVLMVVGLLQKRLIFTLLFLVVTAGLIVANVGYGYNADMNTYGGRVLVYYFTCGVLIYLWRDRIPFHPALFVGALAISYLLLRYPNTAFFTPLFLTYATVFIGLMNLPQSKLLKSGDYSYGVYLYSFPVTRSLVAILGKDGLNFAAMVVLAATLTFLFAIFSWHAVEKHFLKLKRYISKPSMKLTEELHPDAAPADGGSAETARSYG